MCTLLISVDIFKVELLSYQGISPSLSFCGEFSYWLWLPQYSEVYSPFSVIRARKSETPVCTRFFIGPNSPMRVSMYWKNERYKHICSDNTDNTRYFWMHLWLFYVILAPEFVLLCAWTLAEKAFRKTITTYIFQRRHQLCWYNQRRCL